jgi:hypothetical protein
MTLPQLPEPVPFMAAQGQHVYTEAQMLALQRATVEACAKVCDSMNYEVDAYGAQCADAIRSLLDAPSEPKPDFCDTHCTWAEHHPDCIGSKT